MITCATYSFGESSRAFVIASLASAFSFRAPCAPARASQERGLCAAAPPDQLTDASTSARAARVDAWLRDIIVVSDVGSLGERWRQATGGRERSLARPNMPARRGRHKRIRGTLTGP